MVRIGIIGCGGMGKMHAHACQVSDGVDLVGVSDADEVKAKEFSETMGCRFFANESDLVECQDVDAIMICTPTMTHYPLARFVLEKEKPLFVEKPLARTSAKAHELVQLAEEKKVFNQVGHVLRYWLEYDFLKQCIVDQRYGALQSLKLYRECAVPSWSGNNWYLDPSQSGGAALDLHLHDVDMVHYLTGIPESVFARGIKDSLGWRYVISHYLHEEGPLVFSEAAWHYAEKFAFRMAFLASFADGVLDYHSGRTPTLLFFPKQGDEETVPLPPMPETEPVEGINVTDLGGYLLQDQAFFEKCMSGSSDTRAPFACGRDAIATVEAEILSAERGQTIHVGEVRESW